MIAWLVTYAVHSTILTLAVLGLARLFADRPRAVDRMWKAALVGGLVSATVQTAAGVSPWMIDIDFGRSGASAAAAPQPEATAPAVALESVAPAPLRPHGSCPKRRSKRGCDCPETDHRLRRQ